MKYFNSILKLISALLVVILFGCRSNPDFEVLRSEILDLHKSTIDAHWKKDVDFLVKDISRDFISVSNGDIRKPTQEELRSQFSNYLNNTTFTEYADLRNPIIGFSSDGSIAWSIVQVQVAGRRTVEIGSEREFDVTWAWITLYKRDDNRWLRIAEVSNFK